MDEEVAKWVQSTELHAHRWRYGRANRSVDEVDIPGLAVAGDAFGDAPGTVGGAAASGAWAAAKLAWELAQDERPVSAAVQATLF